MHVAALNDLELSAGRHHAHFHARLHVAVHQAHIDDDALVRIVLAVKDQGAQRGVRVAGGGRDIRDDALEHLMDIDADLGRDLRRILRRNADDVLDLCLTRFGSAAGRSILLMTGTISRLSSRAR